MNASLILAMLVLIVALLLCRRVSFARTAIDLFAIESAAGQAFDFDEGSLYD